MSIKEFREKTKLSQSQFADRFGISVRTVQKWEQGQSTPPQYVLSMIEKQIEEAPKVAAKICILGHGSFGKAIESLLKRLGYKPIVWTRNKNIKACVQDCDYLFFAVPAQAFRQVLTKASPYVGDAVIINLAKGIEIGTMKRLSEVAEEVIPGCRYVALSGPSHAEEIQLNLPTNICAASKYSELSKNVQDLLFSEFFRVYTNNDLIGVEIGGAVKNVIALACGIAEGLGFGDNAKAALITRGLAEMARLGEKMGADKSSFFGLSGVGDLIVTCDSMYSRNRRCGLLLGKGLSVEEASTIVGQTVEGITTCVAAHELSQQLNVDMPITNFMYHFVNGDISLYEATDMLLSRNRKEE